MILRLTGLCKKTYRFTPTDSSWHHVRSQLHHSRSTQQALLTGDMLYIPFTHHRIPKRPALRQPLTSQRDTCLLFVVNSYVIVMLTGSTLSKRLPLIGWPKFAFLRNWSMSKTICNIKSRFVIFLREANSSLIWPNG